MIDSLIKFFDDISKAGRLEELSLFANQYGFNFTKRVTFHKQTSRIKGFKLFAKKGTKRFIGILAQIPEKFKGSIRFYDYLKTKDLETKSTSVIEIACEEIFLDYIIIEPKGAFTKMKDFFVSDQKLFPDLIDFHSNFQISSKTPDASSMLKKSALALMTAFPGVTCEIEGNHFIFYTPKKEILAQDIIRMINFTEDFVAALCFDQTDEYV